MSTEPTKRRKIRPDNAIALAKLEKAQLGNKETNEKNKGGEKKKRKADSESVSTTKKTKLNVTTPAPKVYSSASDSDETDDERRTQSAKKVIPTPSKAIAPTTIIKKNLPSKPKSKKYRKRLSKAYVQSDSDSDESTNTKMAASGSNNIKTESTDEKMSASDSDETDKELTATKMSASGSNSTKKEPTNTKVSNDIKTESKDEKMSVSDSDDTDNDHNSTFAKLKVDRSHLKSNRISFRKTASYKDKLSPANNVKNRLNDLFVPEVNEEDFISDSESETDSGEDYDRKEYPSWQRTLSAAHDQEKDPWPKQRKLGYSDKLKLEKRVKKICKREGMTFDQIREIFSSNKRRGHIRLFQQIVKIFPNMSLHRLAKMLKEMYHKKRNPAPWTQEEIKTLEELMKIHGNNPTLISEYMDRSPKNISTFLYSHQTTAKRTIKRWTKEEDELIAKEAAKVLKQDGKISFHTIVPLFKGTRTQRQIHTRYRSINKLIQPDGTLAEKRKATPYEELNYLKSLLAQVRQHRLVEESQLDYVKDRGFVDQRFYLKNRADIKGFERMSIKEILNQLIEKQQRVIESRKAEGILESEPEETA